MASVNNSLCSAICLSPFLEDACALVSSCKLAALGSAHTQRRMSFVAEIIQHVEYLCDQSRATEKFGIVQRTLELLT